MTLPELHVTILMRDTRKALDMIKSANGGNGTSATHKPESKVIINEAYMNLTPLHCAILINDEAVFVALLKVCIRVSIFRYMSNNFPPTSQNNKYRVVILSGRTWLNSPS
jgi:hypothetical protein